jgi:hypothetical protein
MHRVRRFGVIQTANMAAMMYFVMTIIFLVPFFMFASMLPDMGDDTGMAWLSGAALFFVPPLYAAFGWVATAIACWFYNIIAGFVGGIAVDLELED